MSTRVDKSRARETIKHFQGHEQRKAEHTYRVMDLAYIRDGQLVHTDEAVILACLVHTKGRGRATPDMRDVQRIMRDVNLDKKKLKKEV